MSGYDSGKNKTISRRKILRYGALSVAGAVISESLLEPNRLEVRRQTVPIKNLPASFEGFRIGVMSDIHWGSAIDSIYMRKTCDALMGLKPDLVVVPGDFLHGVDRHNGTRARLEGVIESLDSPNGVFGVLGNHDHWIGRNYATNQILTHSRVQLIDNRHVILERKDGPLAVGGIGDLWEDDADLGAAFKGVDPAVPRILISHNPDTAEFIQDDKDTRVDLQISGHTHGGQVILPGIYDGTSRVSKYGSKFNHGLVQGKRHLVYVSKGVGRPHGLRLFAPPDVTCITLTRAS